VLVVFFFPFCRVMAVFFAFGNLMRLVKRLRLILVEICAAHQ
jgi:hypothetical protein